MKTETALVTTTPKAFTAEDLKPTADEAKTLKELRLMGQVFHQCQRACAKRDLYGLASRMGEIAKLFTGIGDILERGAVERRAMEIIAEIQKQ